MKYEKLFDMATDNLSQTIFLVKWHGFHQNETGDQFGSFFSTHRKKTHLHKCMCVCVCVGMIFVSLAVKMSTIILSKTLSKINRFCFVQKCYLDYKLTKNKLTKNHIYTKSVKN